MTRPITRAAALALTSLAALPAAALASETQVSVNSPGSSLVVRAEGSETNQLTVGVDSGSAPTEFVVTDAGPGVTTSDATCHEPTPGVVTCPIGSITKLDIATGNRNDLIVIAPNVPAKYHASIDAGTGDDVVYGGAGDDDIDGSNDTDTLIGGPGSDTLDGGSGNDTLIGGAGNDDMSGDQGNDYLEGDTGADIMRGGTGTDTVSYTDRTTGVMAQIGGQGGNADDAGPGGTDTIDADVENLYGGAGDDELIGSDQNNLLIGGAGNDELIGLGRNDRLLGEDGDDVLFGGAGNDVLKGGFGSDSMFGGPGNDILRARDGTRDRRLRCGPGIDRDKRDRHLDPHGKSCELPRHHHHHFRF